MFKTSAEGAAFIRELAQEVREVTDREVMVAPPFTGLYGAVKAAAGSSIGIAAQDVFWEGEGAYTGEVSPLMVKDAGAGYAIIGHSERRLYFAETDENVGRKVKAALAAGIVPILCIGETLEEREAGRTFEVTGRQLRAGLSGTDFAHSQKVLVAYEPVWAIGTGKTATPAQAQEVHAYLRGVITELWGRGAAESVRILYGGSVKPENIADLMAQADIDGALVGGASLKAADFVEIIRGTAKAKA